MSFYKSTEHIWRINSQLPELADYFRNLSYYVIIGIFPRVLSLIKQEHSLQVKQ